MESVVSLKNVDRTYRIGGEELRALDGVSLDIRRGDFVSIMGPSGSGKSTLMNVIGLLDRPDAGEVAINGKEIGRLDDRQLSRIRGKEIGFVFQSFNLVPRLTALENVELPMIFQGISGAERTEIAKRYMEEVGLTDRTRHRPAELSGGQRQRVAIARALVNDPSILLADEPTGNLDVRTGHEILALFRQMNRAGRTIVVVTHDPEIAALTGRIIRIRDGKITGDSAKETIAVAQEALQ